MVAEGIFVTGMLSSYCTVGDVQRLLSGYDLSRLGSAEDVATRIQELLGATQSAIDGEAGRDFLFHADDELVIDGRGGSTIALCSMGITPLQNVQSLHVDDAEVSADDYVWYGSEGTIRLRPTGPLGGAFREGVQNVRMVVDWGFSAPPAEVSLAQAKLVGAQLLGEAAGDQGSVESLRLGDYSVTYDAGGEHASTISRWLSDARRAVSAYRGVHLAAV